MTDDNSRANGDGAIRDWADIAVSQADVLLRGGGEEMSRVIDDLTTIEGLLPRDDDDLTRAAVVPRLGLLLATRRHAQDGQAAVSHLRWAHRHGTDSDPLAVNARLHLLKLLRPGPEGGASIGEMIENSLVYGGDDVDISKTVIHRHAAEVVDILDRLDAAPLPPFLRRQLSFSRQLFVRLTPHLDGRDDDLLNLVADVPDDAPAHLRMLMCLLRGDAGPDAIDLLASMGVTGPEAERAAELMARVRTAGQDPSHTPDALRALVEMLDTALASLPEDAAQREVLAKMRSYMRLLLSITDPGSWSCDEDDAAAARPVADDDVTGGWPGRAATERHLASYGDLLRGIREGDTNLMETAAARLRRTIDALPGDSRRAQSARSDLARLLSQAAAFSRSLQDTDASVALTRAVRESLKDDARPLADDAFMNIQTTINGAFGDIQVALRDQDPAVFRRVIGELTRLHDSLASDHQWRFTVALTLGKAHREYAALRTGPEQMEHLRQAHRYLREGIEAQRVMPLAAPYLVLTRAVVLADLSSTAPDLATVEEAINALRHALRGPQVMQQQEPMLRYLLGRELLRAAMLVEDHALLDQGVAELERARDMAGEGRGGLRESATLTALSDAYVFRALVGRDEETARADMASAITAGRRALAELAADVLLQFGAEHGLAVARSGSTHALRVAHWAATAGRGAESVEALELGRAMVLRAAAASRDVPSLLEDRGHPELAAEWRDAVPSDLLRPDAAEAFLWQAAEQSEPVVPSALRRRALRTLDARVLLRAPTVPRLAAGLASCGADALVYLLPAAGEKHTGYALLLRPAADSPKALRLPDLTLAHPVLRRYLETAAARSERSGDSAAEAEWRRALDDLCDWAWPAAMGPVLDGLPPQARIVLVPCGPLGVVPWHAARTPREDGKGSRYACEEAVVSYAPSGGELLRAATRRRLSVGEGQVLVADPRGTLLWSAIEIEALRAAYYPSALRFGVFPLAAPASTDAAGTPEELLSVLPDSDSCDGPGPALVHVACHGVAGPMPTRSALRLAHARDLTVAQILDRAAGASASTGGAGPLVVLSACETDLSAGDHDEALTLSTALVARGASDVVGSRWAVNDGATAVMMVAFHHYLADRGLAPADALRAAQRWMLDPDRHPLPALDDHLLREAGHMDLRQVHLWAAFTHQGNPANAAGDGSAPGLVQRP